MSAKDKLAAIQAETERRKKIWAAIERSALDVVKTLRQEAKRRGVKGTAWMEDPDLGGMLFFAGKRGKDSSLIAFLDTNGTVGWNMAEHNANIMYQGYPDLHESAPEHFENTAIETLLGRLNAHCHEHRP